VSERWLSPPEPEEGLWCWNITTACNYRCSYCSQRRKEDRGRWSRQTPQFLAAFARLTGRWEVKLSGGEPFVHPTLMTIVSGLARLDMRISVVTNFSASDRQLDELLTCAAGRLGTFSASLQLEYVDDVPRFAARLRTFRESAVRAAHPGLPRPNVCVTTVATHAALARLPELVRVFAEQGFELKLQPERDEGVIIEYSPAELEAIARHGGHNATGAIAHDFFGRPCWAGARFLVMDDQGEVYRCYPARRSVMVALTKRASRIPDRARERRLGRIGNFLDPSFALERGPAPCLFRHCYCTVPIARGMMARSARGGAA
jgi:MoaA/NifB/PqqE/SkfB family radical SAM enzyme